MLSNIKITYLLFHFIYYIIKMYGIITIITFWYMETAKFVEIVTSSAHHCMIHPKKISHPTMSRDYIVARDIWRDIFYL